MKGTRTEDWLSDEAHAGNDKALSPLSGTPPLSLHVAKNHQHENFRSNAAEYIGEQQSSVDSSSTRTSHLLGLSNDISVGSVNSSRSIRPVLYSAIGSLENYTSTSMGSLKKSMIGPRDFCRLGVIQSNASLIPPLRGHDLKSGASLGSTRDPEQFQLASSTSKNSPAQPPPDKQVSGQNDQEDDKCSNPKSSKFSSPNDIRQKPSSLRNGKVESSKSVSNRNGSKRVSYEKSSSRSKQPKMVEMFRPSCDAYTPRMEKKSFKFKPAEMRTPVQKMASPMGTLQRPNFRDALKRVAMILHQHIVKIERRFEGETESGGSDNGLFKASMRDLFSEANYCTPTYKCTMVRIPMARPGMVYGLRKIKCQYTIPSEHELYDFAHQLFKSVQLSSECSIVCLIYVERLMEVAKVPLLACTWRPIFMCGLLLASKVWQDLSSWNIEFASVYPQFSLDAINRLELNFLRNVKWDLYISTRYEKRVCLWNVWYLWYI